MPQADRIKYETLTFPDPKAFRGWLATNGAGTHGVWLRIYKKASGLPTVTYAEALDEALCYGWIDGQRKTLDDVSYIQKFTPRRPRSLWSKRNIEHVARLTAAGRMTDAGLAEIARAQADGRWEAAYDTPTDMQVPADFLTELSKYPRAEAFFRTLNKTNRYAIAWRLQTAKQPATRERRMHKIIARLDANQKLH